MDDKQCRTQVARIQLLSVNFSGKVNQFMYEGKMSNSNKIP